ncbi:M23 family metallopeptidase [Paenibacillus xylaniclasticus]|uniref:M23 family metallopeptidase n=1 Tax=Paenibacillus xylaniclasticus TaxID=588083 RepID=UPI000FDC1A7B|nr:MULTISPECIES: M23 family metallopeptidase [Paenibacillus]GFN33622.1 hypothetical protein PCURB6_38820 [Paenibacillus curdlanolyticus]
MNNERIRKRHKEKIRQLIEQAQMIDKSKSGGVPGAFLNPFHEFQSSNRFPNKSERQSTEEHSRKAEDQTMDSLPPVDWAAPMPVHGNLDTPSPSISAEKRSTRLSEAAYEQDPEKLWKANAAPWLGSYSDRQSGSRKYNDIYRVEGSSKFWWHFRNQLIVSVILFGIIWGEFKLEGEPAQQVQTAVTAALTTEFDFQSVSAWYERTFAGSPAFIPLFSSGGNTETVEGAALTPQAFVSPLPESTLVKSFAQSLGGIELAGLPDAPVSAAATGQVILVTPDAGEGQTVLIQHAGGRQTLYGQLGEAKVRKDDWVEAGDIIGRLVSGGDGGHSLLYFAVKVDGRFIDPTDVIPLD